MTEANPISPEYLSKQRYSFYILLGFKVS